jgi:hypothetical protein
MEFVIKNEHLKSTGILNVKVIIINVEIYKTTKDAALQN